MVRVPIPSEPLRAFCRRWSVLELSVFGSAVRADFGPDSDVDVLVRFAADAPWSLLDIVRMRDELCDLFGRPVDLVEEPAIRNPFRRSRILGEREVIYAA